jgi:hypothetical protein
MAAPSPAPAMPRARQARSGAAPHPHRRARAHEHAHLLHVPHVNDHRRGGRAATGSGRRRLQRLMHRSELCGVQELRTHRTRGGVCIKWTPPPRTARHAFARARARLHPRTACRSAPVNSSHSAHCASSGSSARSAVEQRILRATACRMLARSSPFGNPAHVRTRARGRRGDGLLHACHGAAARRGMPPPPPPHATHHSRLSCRSAPAAGAPGRAGPGG